MTNSTTSRQNYQDQLVQKLTQDRYALRVAARLSDSAEALPHDVSERLRVARDQALAKRKLGHVKTASSVSVSGGSASMTLGDEQLGWWGRIGAAIPLLALLVGLIAINVVQNDNRARDAAEVDAALLTDELPPTAFTDPGFAQFLKARRDLGQ